MKQKRRSQAVPATLTALIAATLAGCSGSSYNRCEDGRGVTLSDVYCGPNPPPLPAGYVPPAHWVRRTGSRTGGFFGGFGSGTSRGGFGGSSGSFGS